MNYTTINREIFTTSSNKQTTRQCKIQKQRNIQIKWRWDDSYCYDPLKYEYNTYITLQLTWKADFIIPNYYIYQMETYAFVLPNRSDCFQYQLILTGIYSVPSPRVNGIQICIWILVGVEGNCDSQYKDLMLASRTSPWVVLSVYLLVYNYIFFIMCINQQQYSCFVLINATMCRQN